MNELKMNLAATIGSPSIHPQKTEIAMTYPLGSFPRFGHQQRRANVRRQRGIETRQSLARQYLSIEQNFCEVLRIQLQNAKVLNSEGEALIAELDRRLESFRRKHEAGRRVYFKSLVDTLLFFCASAGIHPELKQKTQEELALIVESIGTNHRREKGG